MGVNRRLHISVVDPEPHPVDGVDCSWDYEVIGGEKTGDGDEGVGSSFVINFQKNLNIC